jgi:hypothetical protein
MEEAAYDVVLGEVVEEQATDISRREVKLVSAHPFTNGPKPISQGVRGPSVATGLLRDNQS